MPYGCFWLTPPVPFLISILQEKCMKVTLQSHAIYLIFPPHISLCEWLSILWNLTEIKKSDQCSGINYRMANINSWMLTFSHIRRNSGRTFPLFLLNFCLFSCLGPLCMLLQDAFFLLFPHPNFKTQVQSPPQNLLWKWNSTPYWYL